jgi:hypothetical protein
VQDQSRSQFGKAITGGKNHHGLDYSLFAMDIRENAKTTVVAYLSPASASLRK